MRNKNLFFGLFYLFLVILITILINMYFLIECTLLTAVSVSFLPIIGYLCAKYIQVKDLRKTHIIFISVLCIYKLFQF